MIEIETAVAGEFHANELVLHHVAAHGHAVLRLGGGLRSQRQRAIAHRGRLLDQIFQFDGAPGFFFGQGGEVEVGDVAIELRAFGRVVQRANVGAGIRAHGEKSFGQRIAGMGTQRAHLDHVRGHHFTGGIDQRHFLCRPVRWHQHDRTHHGGTRKGQRIHRDYGRRRFMLDAAGQHLKAGGQRQAADLPRFFETRQHVTMHLIDAAAANGIVRMILEQRLPGLLQEAGETFGARELAGKHAQRLGLPAEQVLAGIVLLLEINARGQHAGEHVVALAGMNFTGPIRQRQAGAAQRVHEARERRVLHLAVRQHAVGIGEDARQIGLRLLMIAAVVDQQMAGVVSARLGHGAERLGFLLEEIDHQIEAWRFRGALLAGFKADLVAVAIGLELIDGQHAAAVGRHPEKLGAQFVLLIAHAAREYEIVDLKAAQNLWQLRDVAEGVRAVADLHHPAERQTDALSGHQIANQRFTADQEFVGQHIPRPNLQPAGLNEVAQAFAVFRADFQIILQHDGLPVKHEVAKLGRAFEQIQQAVGHAHQAHAILLKGAVPLPIPVGVRDHVKFEPDFLRGNDAAFPDFMRVRAGVDHLTIRA